MQPVPPYRPLAPETVVGWWRDYSTAGGLQRLQIVHDANGPKRPGYPTLSFVPFLVLALDGELDLVRYDRGRPERLSIAAGSGVFFAPHTWVDCRHHRSRHYLRFTFDPDYTLFAGKDFRAGPAGRPAGDLQALMLHQGLERPGVDLLARLTSDPVLREEPTMAAAYATTLLHESIRLLAQTPLEGHSAQASWLALRDWCARHWNQPIDRDAAAAAIGVSPGHISRLCRIAGTTTFQGHLQALRLHHAEVLLRSSSMSLEQIALRCHLGSANYLGRLFRRRYGHSPARYRRHQRRSIGGSTA